MAAFSQDPRSPRPLRYASDAAVCPSASRVPLVFHPWSKSQGRSWS